MTLVWLVVWFIVGIIDGSKPLHLDPVNVWTATLILAIGLDLSASHARRR